MGLALNFRFAKIILFVLICKNELKYMYKLPSLRQFRFCVFFIVYFLDIKEIGHTSNGYCEVAQRSVPIVSDIHLALIELGLTFINLNFLMILGSRLMKFEEYAHRPQRRHIPRRMNNTLLLLFVL